MKTLSEAQLLTMINNWVTSVLTVNEKGRPPDWEKGIYNERLGSQKNLLTNSAWQVEEVFTSPVNDYLSYYKQMPQKARLGQVYAATVSRLELGNRNRFVHKRVFSPTSPALYGVYELSVWTNPEDTLVLSWLLTNLTVK